jgi:hypothetical protein
MKMSNAIKKIKTLELQAQAYDFQSILNKAKNLSDDQKMEYVNDLLSKNNILSIARKLFSLASSIVKAKKSNRIHSASIVGKISDKAEVVLWGLCVLAMLNYMSEVEYNNLAHVVSDESLQKFEFIVSM